MARKTFTAEQWRQADHFYISYEKHGFPLVVNAPCRFILQWEITDGDGRHSLEALVEQHIFPREDDQEGQASGSATAWSLQVFEDAWQVFAANPELFTALAQLTGEGVTLATITQTLEQAGFEDRTLAWIAEVNSRMDWNLTPPVPQLAS